MANKYSWLALMWALVILILTLSPSDNLPDPDWLVFDGIDKLVHVVIFAVLAYLVARGTKTKSNEGVNLSLILDLAICVAYGLLIEFLQDSLTETRYFEWKDVLADTIGCVAGVTFFKWRHYT